MQDDEQRIAVGLQLRPLVRAPRVLDGKIVQSELFLHLRMSASSGSYSPSQTKVPGCVMKSLISSTVMSRIFFPS